MTPVTTCIKQYHGVPIAAVEGDEGSIRSKEEIAELLDLVKQQLNTPRLLVHRKLIQESMFDLKSGFLGELTEKIQQHQIKLAVVGQFNVGESLVLKAYLFNSRLNHLACFFKNERQAIEWLTEG